MSDNNKKKEIYCETDIHKCPSCGAFMVFSPKHKKLHCDYCHSTIEIVADKSREIVYKDTVFTDFKENVWNDEVVSYRCNSCGAVCVMDKYVVADKCPFCSVTNIAQIDNLPTIKPNAVIPFNITEECAKNYFLKWLKGKLFAPNRLKKTLKVDRLKGLYIPCWTYDLITNASYSGVLYKRVVKRVGSGKNARTVVKTINIPVSGKLSKNYDDIIIEASHQLTPKDIKKIGGYRTNDSREYKNQYLAGFSAERNDISVVDGLGEAKKIVYKDYEKSIISRHGADGIRTLNINIDYKHITYKYVMLPLWMSSYKYNEKQYRYIVNGESGKVYGNIPISPIKATFAALLGIGALILIYFIYINYFA